MSHYHSDHTGNANLFAGATWIVQKAEHDVMFADKPVPHHAAGDLQRAQDAKTKILNNEDFDIFGDGTVVIKTTPGHTPGHQVLFVKLAKPAGGPVGRPVSLPGGDRDRQDADFEFDPPMSAKSRAALQAFAKQTGAKLWIEHDKPTHANLPKAPKYLNERSAGQAGSGRSGG